MDRAIKIAKRAGIPLKILAKVDAVDREYYETVIRPLLDHPLIEFLGECGDAEKNELLGNAAALLFPIDWPEPFGLAMIEAMACGTPVVAYRKGSVPELIEDGVTGRIVDNLKEAVKAVQEIGTISRRGCYEAFQRRFTAARMARDYVYLYRKLLKMDLAA